MMTEHLTEPDQRRLAHWAEMIHGMNAEAAGERARLDAADEPTWRAVLSDRSGPPVARATALMLLLARHGHRRDGTLSEILLPLWDDPDQALARLAVQYAPPFEPEVTARLKARLDDPERMLWSSAATVLARWKVMTIVPRLRAWFHEGDRDHRNVAWACLCWYRLLDSNERRTFLREAWDAGGRDDDDRAMLALGLLERGDRVGWPFLVELARKAEAHSAVWAAETIHGYDPALGLELMLHILDHGSTFEARWGMVERIARSAGLPHLFTADGLAEARFWVEQQRELLEQSGPGSG